MNVIKKLKKYSAEVFFALLTLLVLGPMLVPGYILTLDMSWGPNLPLVWNADTFNNAFSLRAALYVLSLLMPTWLVQKLLLIGLTFLLFYIPYRFLPVPHNTARVFAAMLYALNPFVYSRVLAGQWMILLSYALLPLLLFALLRLTAEPNRKHALLFLAALFLISVGAIHFVYLSILFSLFFIAAFAGKAVWQKQRALAVSIVKWSGVGFALFLLVCSYWIVPALLRTSPLEAQFDEKHFEVFAAAPNESTPVWRNVAVLGGFWAERQAWKYYFVWPQEHALFWSAALLLLVLVLLGLYKGIQTRETRFFTVLICLTAAGAYVTALGAADTPLYNFNMWLYEHMPGWNGLRDSHKLVSFLALSYACLTGIGVSHVFTYLKEKNTHSYAVLMPVFFILPVVFGMYQWGGYQQQLEPVWYPQTWHSAKEVLDADPEKKVLVLPWHGYFSIPFANQIPASNPAPSFFGRDRTIAARNAEIGDVYDQETGRDYKAIDMLVRNASHYSLQELREELLSRDIEYVMVITNNALSEGDAWYIPPPDVDNQENMQEEQIANFNAFMKLDSVPLLQGDIVLLKLTNNE